MNKYLKQKYHLEILEVNLKKNATKRRNQTSLNYLYGCGEMSKKFAHKFFNTFGENFGGFTSQQQLILNKQESNPETQDPIDHPIDMKFLETLNSEVRYQIQSKCP